MEENRAMPQSTPSAPENSYFDGTTLQLIGWRLLGILLCAVTLGIGFPWAQCMLYRWEAKHTVIGGKRLRFDGRGIQLVGKFLLWCLLTIITLGIYALFIPVKLEKWRVSHLRYADDAAAPAPAASGGKVALCVIGIALAVALLGGIVFGAFAFFVPKGVEHPEQLIPDSYEDYVPEQTIPTPTDTYPTQSTDEQPLGYYVDAPKGGLNVRSGPGTDYEIVGRLEHGTPVYPERWEGNWAYINGALTGWCSGDYLTQAEPKQDLEPEDFLAAYPPKDKTLLGSWMVVSNMTRYDDHASCRAGVIELKADGTFTHRVYDYMRFSPDGIWHCPGTETSGGDCPYWVGEYTYDGTTLVLVYRAEHVTEYTYDSTGFPMPADSYWDMLHRQITLTLTPCEDGYMVNAPWEIPMHTTNTAGDGSTVATLYRVTNGADAFDIPYQMLPVYYP